MTRQTSIDVFNKIKESGLLSRKRLEVYSVLFEHGPLTGAQVTSIMRQKGFISTVSETVRNRITELHKMKAVDIVKTVKCPITSQTVIQWDVSNKLPVKITNDKKVKCHNCDGKGFINV